jgi:hypothetical protein
MCGIIRTVLKPEGKRLFEADSSSWYVQHDNDKKWYCHEVKAQLERQINDGLGHLIRLI